MKPRPAAVRPGWEVRGRGHPAIIRGLIFSWFIGCGLGLLAFALLERSRPMIGRLEELPGLLAAVAQGERDGVAGFVIACFGDPGLDAARELASGPVVGIAEAGMHAATLVGRSFSIVTTLGRTIGQAEHLVRRYGFADQCRSIYACEVPVLELDQPGSDARRLVVDHCRRAVEFDEADSVLLGCAGMADFAAEVSAQVGVPVIDGVTAGVVLVESLVRLGLRTSTRSEYAAPLPKDYR